MAQLPLPPPPLIYEFRFFDFSIYLPNWGTTRIATCISHANVHQQWGSKLLVYMCIAWFSQKCLSNTNTLITEVIIITCKKKGKKRTY